MRTIFTLLLALIITTSFQAQGTNLSLNLKKGKEYKQNIISRGTIIQEVNGQKTRMGMTTNGTMIFLVKDITDSGYIMETKFEKLGMSIQMPQGTMEFSSEKNDSNDIFSTIFSAMKNKTFEISMSKTGKITEVKNLETLWGTAIDQFDQLSEMQKEQIKAQIMKAYGVDAVKGNIEMVTSIYPDKPVNIGDIWNINTRLESGMSAKLTTNFEFTELTDDYALIKGNSSIRTTDKDAYVKTNGMSLKYGLTGSMTSDIKVDKNSGWIIEGVINQEIKGEAHIKDNPQLPNGMKIPMTLRNEVVIANN